MELILRAYDDRRRYDFGPPRGFPDRRASLRRESDKFRMMLKRIFELHMEDTISDAEVKSVLTPVLKKINAGFGQKNLANV